MPNWLEKAFARKRQPATGQEDPLTKEGLADALLGLYELVFGSDVETQMLGPAALAAAPTQAVKVASNLTKGQPITTLRSLAIRYLSDRYPRLAKEGGLSNVLAVTRGPFKPGIRGQAILTPDYSQVRLAPSATPETGAHELKHVAQYMEDPSAFDDYIPYEVDPVRYFSQPLEVSARQAGRSVANKLEDIITEIMANKYGVSAELKEPKQAYNLGWLLELLKKTSGQR